MPSFTDTTDSGSDFPGSQPILGTGLNISSKATNGNGAGNGDSSTMSSMDGQTPRKHRASVGKKPIRRPSSTLALGETETTTMGKSGADEPQDSLFNQVYGWLQREKAKQRTHGRTQASNNGLDSAVASDGDDDDEDTNTQKQSPRSNTPPNKKTLALERLEKILLEYSTAQYDGSNTNTSVSSMRRSGRRRTTTKKGLRRASASESDSLEEFGAPAVDAFLDNTKTLAYGSGGNAEDEDGVADSKRREVWTNFKADILRLTHTLEIKGWRKVPQEHAADIDVVRLSGAMTNSVYVVSPPASLPIPPRAEDGSYTLVPVRPPSKLLLRIYGPQVEHLIDREKELQILRRLCRKNIGPRVLGTFNNGRFEQYFEARTLTAEDLRQPDTMKQIAKRMRELHEGIELEEDEREAGPMVFQNWDKWVDRCEQVVNWLDKEIESEHNAAKAQTEAWRRRGYVYGVPWPVFRGAVDRYRRWLEESCGGFREIKRQLVFAHNDTQNGNLLRLEPKSESPLLLPANEHKQLVVIDFEYASANTPGFEFANHFSEWCYNYLDPEYSYYFDIKRYPSLEQQRHFISSYVGHQPSFTGPGQSNISPLNTPRMRALSNNPPAFALDDDNSGTAEAEKEAENIHEAQVEFLMRQTRLWRVINSAQWAAWGVVQAKIPGMDEGTSSQEVDGAAANGSHDAPSEENGDDSDEFDYLAYAQDRSMIFWADMYALGLVREGELPSSVVDHIKGRLLMY